MVLKRRCRTHRAATAVLFVTAILCASVWTMPSPSPAQTAAPATADQKSNSGPMRVSTGVAVGNIIRKVSPIYPFQARAHHIEGTVLMHAIIGKDGAIYNLSAVSGPPLLQSSAMDAVRQWKFKPFLLNGDPVAIETDIAVDFHLMNH